MKVSVAIITCQRPQALLRLLASLAQLESDHTIEIVVVDNDPQRTALTQLQDYKSPHELKFIHEPVRGIPFARNTALKACSTNSDYVAFLDDDEEASPQWLQALLDTIQKTGADAVGGSVLPVYPASTPAWIINGRFFERKARPDQQPCRMLATNNCLIDAVKWRQVPFWFNTKLQYTGSSDTLFFLTARKVGWRFVWSTKAFVSEHIPPQRLTVSWIIKRQYRIGNGLAMCDRLAYGNLHAIPRRLLIALTHAGLGSMQLLRLPFAGKAAWAKALACFARAAGGVAGLCGRYYEEYAPHRLIGEAQP